MKSEIKLLIQENSRPQDLIVYTDGIVQQIKLYGLNQNLQLDKGGGIIIMYIYHALINALSTHMMHINLNTIFYTHVGHLPKAVTHAGSSHPCWIASTTCQSSDHTCHHPHRFSKLAK